METGRPGWMREGYRLPQPEKTIMEFDEVSKRIAAAIGEAEKNAPIGMFAQLLQSLEAALTGPDQWPTVARDAALTSAEIGNVNFFNWLDSLERCKDPIRKTYRLTSEFVGSHHMLVEDRRFLVYRLIHELQGISTHSSPFTALTALERIAQLSVRISFELARAKGNGKKVVVPRDM